MAYSQGERVFIPEHRFALKPFAAVSGAFSSSHPDEKVPNKAKILIPLKKLRGFSPPAKYTDRATAACRRS
jgi:hypothetical protein